MTELERSSSIPAEAEFAVLGCPIEHSLSPTLHSAAFKVQGFSFVYHRFEVQRRGLGEFFDSHPQVRGASVTMPLKQDAYDIADYHDEDAELTGIANTLTRDPATGRFIARNTDVRGLAGALEARQFDLDEVVLLGSGATARSAVFALVRLGARSISIRARNEEDREALVRNFAGVSGVKMSAAPLVEPMPSRASLVLSTLPVAGAHDFLPVVSTQLQDMGTGFVAPLYDVIYDPWPTPLAQLWQHHRLDTHTGLSMLVEQAILQQRAFLHGDTLVALQREHLVREQMQLALRDELAARNQLENSTE